MIPAVLPYGLLIRAGAVLAFGLLMGAGGFKCGVERGAAKLEKANHALYVAEADRAMLADALNQVNAAAAQAQRDAAVQQAKADDAVQQAAMDRTEYDNDLAGIERELESARRSPTCRAQLETTLCVLLH